MAAGNPRASLFQSPDLRAANISSQFLCRGITLLDCDVVASVPSGKTGAERKAPGLPDRPKRAGRQRPKMIGVRGHHAEEEKHRTSLLN